MRWISTFQEVLYPSQSLVLDCLPMNVDPYHRLQRNSPASVLASSPLGLDRTEWRSSATEKTYIQWHSLVCCCSADPTTDLSNLSTVEVVQNLMEKYNLSYNDIGRLEVATETVMDHSK